MCQQKERAAWKLSGRGARACRADSCPAAHPGGDDLLVEQLAQGAMHNEDGERQGAQVAAQGGPHMVAELS